MTEKMWLNKIKSLLEEDTININDIDNLLIDIRKTHIEMIEIVIEYFSYMILFGGMAEIEYLNLIEPKLLDILVKLTNICFIKYCLGGVKYLFFECDKEQKQIEEKIDEIVNEEDKEFLKKVLTYGKLKK